MLLKIILNTHSTIVMARMGKVLSNFMTWVRPSNNKLIDRAIRYITYLHDFVLSKLNMQEKKITLEYSTVCLALHQESLELKYG
jgi:N-acetylmuramic acid 6-phosphate etherase